jgi:Zn-dependent peptidase ImmA (M78 family)
MLTWARESLGMSIGMAAERLHMAVDRLRAWESGDPEQRPTVAQVEKLAKVYDRPVSMLYLPQPPDEADFPADFRFTQEAEEEGLSPDLRKIIRRVRTLREAAVNLAEEVGEVGERFPAITMRARLDDDAEAMGLAARRWLGIGDEPHTNLQDAEAAFAHWRTAMEDRGVLVFMSLDGMPVTTFRGFALVEERAPAIAINNKDEKPARLFTLLHELGHIVLGRDGICGDLTEIPTDEREEARIEVWCNRFAGAALVPGELLRAEPEFNRVVESFDHLAIWDRVDDNRLRGLSRRFAVSVEVIVRRLTLVGAITDGDYRGWRRTWYERYPIRRPGDDEREGGPGQTQLAPHRLGFGYLRVVFEAYWSDKVSLYDVCRLVGNVKVETVRKIEERFKHRLFTLAG